MSSHQSFLNEIIHRPSIVLILLSSGADQPWNRGMNLPLGGPRGLQGFSGVLEAGPAAVGDTAPCSKNLPEMRLGCPLTCPWARMQVAKASCTPCWDSGVDPGCPSEEQLLVQQWDPRCPTDTPGRSSALLSLSWPRPCVAGGGDRKTGPSVPAGGLGCSSQLWIAALKRAVLCIWLEWAEELLV